MVEAVECIVLRVTRHSDSSSIATLWCRGRGRLAAVLPAGNGREARRMKALMMPLGMIQAVADFRPGRDIVRLREVRPLGCGNPAAGDPGRTVTALFLCDFLGTVLRQSPPDDHITDYIFTAAEALSRTSGTALANYHLVFLYRLGAMLGIEPDTRTYSRGRLLDMREGLYRDTAPAHSDVLGPDEARAANVLSQLSFDHTGLWRMSRTQRNRALDLILQYYSLHLTPVTSMPSLEVVRSLYS